MSSKAVAPCMTITLAAISSAWYAAASFWTARTLRRCVRVDDIFRPRPLFCSPIGFIPSTCAGERGFPFAPGDRRAPKAGAERPDAARTAKSDASSIKRRIVATERKTPGSMGGGTGLGLG
ncbi:hypothetical protein FRC20_009213 [Serendipita sp. 405]|nr:hypothetical protein FRC15_007359 [Serendipita sp. 397]KAG8865977.1 hypothetical protein FRC20_009213 [Serendipita sp. 405]